MPRDQLHSIVITASILVAALAIVYPEIAPEGLGAQANGWLDMLAIVGIIPILFVGWARYRINGASKTGNIDRAANFSFCIGLSAVCLLVAFVCGANLTEDGLRDLSLIGGLMIVSRTCLRAVHAWWVSLLAAVLMMWHGPGTGVSLYLAATVLVLILSRIIPVMMEYVIYRRSTAYEHL